MLNTATAVRERRLLGLKQETDGGKHIHLGPSCEVHGQAKVIDAGQCRLHYIGVHKNYSRTIEGTKLSSYPVRSAPYLNVFEDELHLQVGSLADVSRRDSIANQSTNLCNPPELLLEVGDILHFKVGRAPPRQRFSSRTLMRHYKRQYPI